MTVVAPPEPPRTDEREALIREARARQRRRKTAVAAVAAAALAAGLAVSGGLSVGSTGPRAAQGPGAPFADPRGCPPGNLGTLAFIRGHALRLLDLKGCRVRTLVRGHVHGRVGLSADGRWVSFGGGYVSARGGPVHRLPGKTVWSPRADILAVVTRRGGLELERAGGKVRRLLPDGWGAQTAVFSPNGRRLAVSRTARRAHVEEIWLVDLATGSRRELFREPRRQGAPPLLQSMSPNGRWLLFWKDLDASASLLADGVPLLALPVAGGRPRYVTSELYYDDFVSWCGGRLVYVLNRKGRFVTQGDGIASADPPSWRPTTLLPANGSMSWASFSCSRAGTLAVAAGPRSEDEPFGHEHRSIWLVHGRKASVVPAARPPRGASDEWPSWSADGSWLLFVRTRWNGHGWPGSLYAVDLATGKLVGPIANVGTTSNYYGHYGWSTQLSWHRP